MPQMHGTTNPTMLGFSLRSSEALIETQTNNLKLQKKLKRESTNFSRATPMIVENDSHTYDGKT